MVAVVGVILNLSLWFALHTLFGRVEDRRAGTLQWDVPVWSTLSLPTLVLAVLAGLALSHLKLGTLHVLIGAAWFGMTRL